MRTSYKRILLKLSGESLMGAQGYGIDPVRVGDYAEQIKELAQAGVEIAIVIGGGNIFRGLAGAAKGVDRVKGDQMGMLATVINSLALCSALEKIGQPAQVFTAVNMFPIGEHYSKWKAIDAMKRRQGVDNFVRHGQPVLHHRHRLGSARHRGGGRRDAQRHTRGRHLYRRP